MDLMGRHRDGSGPPLPVAARSVAFHAKLPMCLASVGGRAYIVGTIQERRVVKAKIVRIGNSQGIRIPKPVLEQVGLPEEVELEVEDNTIIIRPFSRPREGWADVFKSMAEAGDDELLDEEAATTSSWDAEEWEW
jgi:antitoxin MazE